MSCLSCMVRGTVNVLQTPPFYVVFLHLFFFFFVGFLSETTAIPLLRLFTTTLVSTLLQ